MRQYWYMNLCFPMLIIICCCIKNVGLHHASGGKKCTMPCSQSFVELYSLVHIYFCAVFYTHSWRISPLRVTAQITTTIRIIESIRERLFSEFRTQLCRFNRMLFSCNMYLPFFFCTSISIIHFVNQSLLTGWLIGVSAACLERSFQLKC